MLVPRLNKSNRILISSPSTKYERFTVENLEMSPFVKNIKEQELSLFLFVYCFSQDNACPGIQ